MNKYKLLFSLTSAVVSTLGFAGSMGAADAVSPWQKVATLSIGPSWTKSGETETFYVQPGGLNTYDAQRKTSAFTNGELFLGIQHGLSAMLLGQLGLELAATTGAKVHGDIWVYGEQVKNNYSFTYKINHYRVALKGKLIGQMHTFVQPYVSASIGTGYNHARSFDVIPKIFGEVPPPPFTKNTVSSCAYTLGAGIQKQFTPEWSAGVGYEYASLGKTQLERAPEQTLNTGLRLNHVYANGIQFNISYTA